MRLTRLPCHRYSYVFDRGHTFASTEAAASALEVAVLPTIAYSGIGAAIAAGLAVVALLLAAFLTPREQQVS